MTKIQIGSLTVPMEVPHLQATASLEFIADNDVVQINVMDRNGLIQQTIRIEFNFNGELELNAWADSRIPGQDDPWVSNTLLLAEETREII